MTGLFNLYVTDFIAKTCTRTVEFQQKTEAGWD